MTSRDELVEAALGTWWLALGVTPGPSALVSDAMTQRTAEQAMRAVVDVVEAGVLRRVRASIEALPDAMGPITAMDLPHGQGYVLKQRVLAAVDAVREETP